MQLSTVQYYMKNATFFFQKREGRWHLLHGQAHPGDQRHGTDQAGPHQGL